MRKCHTDENEGTSLYFKSVDLEKYLHTQAQPHTFLKAHYNEYLCENGGKTRSPSVKRAFVPVCANTF